MTRSTKLLSRKKPARTAGPSPYAPRYPTLDIDGYGALLPDQRARYDLMRDLEQILDAQPHARLELDTIGWRTNLRYSDSAGTGSGIEQGWRHTPTPDPECSFPPGHILDLKAFPNVDMPDTCRDEHWTYFDEATLNSVEAAAATGALERSERLTEWLAEAKEATAQVTRAARFARRVGPRPLEAGTQVGGVVVGGRAETAETCAWCGDVAIEGRDDQGKALIRRVDGKAVHATPCYWTLAKQAQRAGRTIPAQLLSNGPTHAETP